MTIGDYHCQKCKSNTSTGEKDIEKWLVQQELSFKREKMFPGLRGVGGGPLRFDFYVCGALIEFDGGLHFKSCSMGNWDRIREHDKRKNQYAFSKKIPLLRIAYTSSHCIPEILLDFFTKYAYFNFAGNKVFKEIYGINFQTFTLSDPKLYNRLAKKGMERDMEMKREQTAKTLRLKESVAEEHKEFGSKQFPGDQEQESDQDQTLGESSDAEPYSKPWRPSKAWIRAIISDANEETDTEQASDDS